MVIKICANCGNAFTPKQRRGDRPQAFCSQSCYHGFRDPLPELHCLPRGFGDWFAGFVDGEGHFGIVVRDNDNVYLTFSISLRADDANTLQEIQRILGIGTTHTHTHKKAEWGQIALKWQVTDLNGCALLVKLFEKYPLRSKKARELPVWAEALTEKMKGTRQNKERLLELRKQILDIRKWENSIQHVKYQYRFTDHAHNPVPQTPWH